MDRTVRTLLGAAVGCAALFALVIVAAYAWGPAQSLDLLGLEGFVSANDGSLAATTADLTRLGDPLQVVLITGMLAALALARGRPRVALAIVALIGATSVSGQVLKALLAHSREVPFLGRDVGPEAFPSGHATAAMSLALAAVIAAPRRARLPAALLGSLVALAVGASVMAWAWHFPSDVIGGYLLATGWALVVVAALREADRRFPASDRWAATTLARASERVAVGGLSVAAVGGGVILALAGAAVVVANPDVIDACTRDHTSAMAVGAGVASAALALPVAMAALMRRG
jgi:membrane-associated phospholipid phosphatase